MRFSLLPLALTCLLATPALTEGKSIIVLDASGSMWGQIDGRAKLEIAREALGQVLQGIPADTEIGLMAYGHRSKGDCNDIELVVPPAKGTAAAITAAANEMKFLGKTPLSEAVRKAAEDLRYTEEKANVILITDGIETCNADPCALGTELEQTGVDFTAHVVGFGLTEEEGRAVACLAENTGGRYIQASDAGTLVDALKTTVAIAEPQPQPEPVPEPPPAPAKLETNVDPILRLIAGQDEPQAVIGDAIFEFYPMTDEGPSSERADTIYGNTRATLPAGKYLVRARLHKATAEAEFEASETEMAYPEMVLDAGILRLRVLAGEGGEPDRDGFFEIRGPGDIVESGYSAATVVLPAQEYALLARLGSAETNQSLVIEAGQELSKDVVMGIGVAGVSVTYDGSQTIDDGDLHIEIFEAKADLDGNRKSAAYNWGNNQTFDLSPGDYVAVVKLDAAQVEMPLTIRTGERSDIALNLNAGVAAFTTPADQQIEVLAAKKDIAGNRASFAYGWGPEWQTTLAAGDYVVKVEKDGATSETPFTIKAGERVELALAP